MLLQSVLPESSVKHLNYENHFWKELKQQTKTGMLPKFIMMRWFWQRNFCFGQMGEQIDLAVYGSDMIWHMGSTLFPLDRNFFGFMQNAKKKISYAPSVGPRVSDEPYWLGNQFKNFFALSVRDHNTQNLVLEHSNIHAELVIDPCFFLIDSPYSEWFVGQKRYDKVSVYSPSAAVIAEVINSNTALNKTLNLKSLKPQLLGYFPRKSFFRHLVKQLKDPLWTVQQVAQSKLLVTSTFHGVMMALMTGTPFIVIKNPSLVARLESPISKTFSSERVLNIDELSVIDSKKLDLLMSTDDLNFQLIDSYIKSSKAWILSVLSRIKE